VIFFLFTFISTTYIIKCPIYLFSKFLCFRAIFCFINPKLARVYCNQKIKIPWPLCQWLTIFSVSKFRRVLTMVYNTQDYFFFFWTFPSFYFLETSTTFRKLDMFPSSGERGRRHLLILAP
jgi:hypothetical protein